MSTPVEVSWFAALCDDDYTQLGVVDPARVSSWSHCRDIALTADRHGFDNLLLPSGYTLGIDGTAFVDPLAVQFDRFVRDEVAKWTRIIRDAGIKLE